MNGRQIEIFHAVMKAGTVTDAAARLGITQPAVTASLKQIEAAIGFNLFHRKGGRLQPTAEARILYREAERIQDSLEVFRRLGKRLRNDLTSHLRVVTPPAFSHSLVPDVVADFVDQASDCLIDITTQHHEQILKDISGTAGLNNLGITFGKDERPGVGSLIIGKTEIVALVPNHSPLAAKECLSAKDLVGTPLVGTFAGEPLGNAVEQMMLEAGHSADYSIRAHNHSVAANLASKGVGTAIVDSFTADYARRSYTPDSFSVIPIEQAPSLPVTAVFSYRHPLNEHARRFIELFRNKLAQGNVAK